MESGQLLEVMKRLDRQGRVRFYLSLAMQLTVRGREAYSYQPERAREVLKGINELLHSVVGHTQAVNSDSPRTPDEEFSARLFDFAKRLGVGAHLPLALDAIPRKYLCCSDDSTE
jgi:hypothetical protein